MNFDDQILIACNNIDQNLANDNLHDKRGFVSQNILAQLRNLVEYIFQKIYSETGEIDLNQTQEEINKKAIQYARSKTSKYQSLIHFHNFLQKSASHYLLSETSSERLMLKYFTYLIKCRKFLKEKYKMDVLKNLTKFPLDLDKKLTEYYEKIANILENQNISHHKKGENDIFYITKIKPFIIKEQIYYEVIFIHANDSFSKFDKLIAFCKFRIFDNYAVNLQIHNETIKVSGKTIQVKIIDSWEVAIRPAELQNFGKIFGINKALSKTNEYRKLMRFLTEHKISLVDLIDRDDYEEIKREIALRGKSLDIFNILDSAKAITENGKNTVRYLLHGLRNQIIKKQSAIERNKYLSNLKLAPKCFPFECMPFATSLLNHNPSFYDLIECIDTKGREHEIFARELKNRIETSGNLFIGKKEFDSAKVDGLIKTFNEKLWEGHSDRKIKEFNNHLYIAGYVQNSIEIIKKLLELTQGGIKNYSISAEDWLKENPNLIDDQKKKEMMIKLFEKSRVALIYGAAGTGKTTFINYVSRFSKDRKKIFLAHTNTAIDNLKRRMTSTSNSKFETIAKSLADTKEQKCDILFIDECSIIDNDEMKRILNKIDFKLLFLAGDTYQIEAISFGNWFQIAKCFLPQEITSTLKETYRTKDKKLLTLWKEVRNFDKSISEILQRENYSKRLEDLILKRDEDEIVLCLNYDGLYGINNLNTILQEGNEEKEVKWKLHRYKVGDPILFNETGRFKPLIYNNMKGEIVDIEVEENKIWFSIEIEKTINELDAEGYDFTLLEKNGKSVIKFYIDQQGMIDEDGKEHDEKTIVPFHVAYAISIHKAQGLEYKSVKIVISNEVDEMITHNIFYTAITRAKEKLQIYWSPEVEKRILESFKKRDIKRDIDFLKQLGKLATPSECQD